MKIPLSEGGGCHKDEETRKYIPWKDFRRAELCMVVCKDM